MNQWNASIVIKRLVYKNPKKPPCTICRIFSSQLCVRTRPIFKRIVYTKLKILFSFVLAEKEDILKNVQFFCSHL